MAARLCFSPVTLPDSFFLKKYGRLVLANCVWGGMELSLYRILLGLISTALTSKWPRCVSEGSSEALVRLFIRHQHLIFLRARSFLCTISVLGGSGHMRFRVSQVLSSKTSLFGHTKLSVRKNIRFGIQNGPEGLPPQRYQK